MESNNLNEFDQWIKGELNQFQPTPPPAPHWQPMPKGHAGVQHWYQSIVAKIAGGVLLSGALVYGVLQVMDQPNSMEPLVNSSSIQKNENPTEVESPLTQIQDASSKTDVTGHSIPQNNENLKIVSEPKNVNSGTPNQVGGNQINQNNSNTSVGNLPLSDIKQIGNNPTLESFTMIGPDKVIVNKWVDLSVSTVTSTLQSISWDFDDGSGALTNNHVRHQFEKPGTYKVKAYQNSNQLLGEKTIQVVVPEVNFDFSGMGESVLFEATGAEDIPGVVYSWNFGDGTTGTGKTIKHSYTNNVEHTYIVWLSVGVPGQHWSMSRDKKVQIEERKLKLLIPNVFTPNGDGINDEYRVSGFTDVGFRMAIINAAGNEVYFSTNPEKGWDGTDGSGKPCPEGNYFLIIHYQDESSQMQQDKSTIKLLKGN